MTESWTTSPEPDRVWLNSIFYSHILFKHTWVLLRLAENKEPEKRPQHTLVITEVRGLTDWQVVVWMLVDTHPGSVHANSRHLGKHGDLNSCAMLGSSPSSSLTEIEHQNRGA